MVRGKAALCLFCESSSIRGMAKIVRSKTRFLRLLWLVFVVLSTGGLFTCITLLIFDFLNYDISVQTRVTPISSAFPAITVCHHHPFSRHAYELWKNKTVLSPRDFNLMLRQRGYASLKQEDVNATYYSFIYDSMSIYYQNIPYEHIYNIGHDYSTFKYCVRIHSNRMEIEDDCQILEGFTVKRFSHEQFFNCYTFEPSNRKSAISTQFLSLIVSLSSKPDFTKYEQGLFMDIFEQAKGLRVVVHEAGTLPDLTIGGIHIEPGKFNEINYQPKSWNRLNTPKRPCIKNTTNRFIRDLDQTYTYTNKKCQELETQRRMMADCKCIYSPYPRASLPTSDIPYCASFKPSFEAFLNRVKCIDEFSFNSDSDACLDPCDYYEYETSVSITQWRAQSWQLHWVVLQNNALRHLLDVKNNNKSIKSLSQYKQMEDYFTKKDLININGTGDIKLDGDAFTYVVLKRKTGIVVENTERLVFSLNVLLSRIGGLCSLTIGLTAAFVVEIIEFLYVFHISRSEHHHHKELFTQNDTTNNHQKRSKKRKCIPVPDNDLQLQDAEEFLEKKDMSYL